MKRVAIVLCLAAGAAQAQERGITPERLVEFDDPSMPAKEMRLLRTTYAPSAENPKHYHTSHIVFYVLEGTGVWQEEGKQAVTLKPGDSLHVRPGTIHSHHNASKSEKLVFLEFVIVEKGQRSTVRMP
jgi:quercetin dioxygenase-like cupin family protein